MSWIKKLILLCSFYLLCFYSNAQQTLLPLSKLANCRIYKVLVSDTLKKSDAYKNSKKVKAIHYFDGYVNGKKASQNLPFDSVTFPNLQFLILENMFRMPENLSQFKNLQVLFVNDEIPPHYQNNDMTSNWLDSRPKSLDNQIYELPHLKILYSNALAPHGYDFYTGFPFYFDINKLKQMKELQLIDLPDGLMDDKLLPTFFAPGLKVIINSEDPNYFDDYSIDVEGCLKKKGININAYPALWKFEFQSNKVKFICKNLHQKKFRIKKKLIFKDASYNEVLKSYVSYLNSTKNLSSTPSKEFTIYKDENFEYSCNLIEIPNVDIPLLDTNEVKTNKLFQRYFNFTRFKVHQNVTYYYYPKSNAYIINITYYNGLDNYRQNIKWYSPISSNKVRIKWIEINDETWEDYDYKVTKKTTIKHKYQIQEKFNKDIIIK